MGSYKVLNDEQVQSFLDKGYLVVHDAVDLSIANRWIDDTYDRLGYDKHNPGTWVKGLIHMDHKNQMPVRDVAPKAWAALIDMIGGEDLLETQVMKLNSSGHFSTINSWLWSDAFIINFNRGADQSWQPPSPQVGGWHKDGSYFRHFIDSREQALLPIVLWSDMVHQGGATFIAPDSVRVIARYLYEHPEGVHPHDFNFQELISKCAQFEEVTGKAGDFVIMHPFMLHASSQNALRRPRFIWRAIAKTLSPLRKRRETFRRSWRFCASVPTVFRFYRAMMP